MPESHQNPLDLSGKRIGEYHLLTMLSKEGAYGQVYLARNVESVEQLVAVKIIRSLLKQSIDAELKALQSINSRDVVNIRRAFPVQEPNQAGHQYVAIVMEFVGGGSLSAALKRINRELDFTVIRAGMRQIAVALREVHGLGYWHRDIKPGNILLQPIVTGVPDFVLADFGIAKLVEQGDVVSNRAIGTPPYMAPELWESTPDAPADKRTDIYALGIVLYELVTGQLPFLVKNKDEWASVHRFGSYTLPSQLPSSADVPPELESLIAKAMHRDLAQRFQTMDEFLSALDSLPPLPSSPDRMTGAEFGQLVRQIETEVLSPWQGGGYKLDLYTPDKTNASLPYLFTGPATIGSTSDSDVVLASVPGLAARQIQLLPDDGHVNVTNLIDNGIDIKMDGTSLLFTSAVMWHEKSWLQFSGGYELQLVSAPRPHSGLLPGVDSIEPVVIEDLAQALAEKRFSIRLEPGLVDLGKESFKVWVMPEDVPPLAYSATVRVGSGLQDEWFISGTPQVIAAGDRQAIDIAIRIPPGAIIQDQHNTITVTVFTQDGNMPSASITAPVIVPQREKFAVSLDHTGSGDLRRPKTMTPRLRIQNTGNTVTNYSILLTAPESLAVTVQTKQIPLQPGAFTEVPIQIQPRRKDGSTAESVQVTVRASSGQEERLRYDYRYIPRTNPWVSNLMRWLFMGLLAALVLAILFPEQVKSITPLYDLVIWIGDRFRDLAAAVQGFPNR